MQIWLSRNFVVRAKKADIGGVKSPKNKRGGENDDFPGTPEIDTPFGRAVESLKKKPPSFAGCLPLIQWKGASLQWFLLRRVPFPKSWKATKEYLNQRGTKIRVFRVWSRAPFLPPFFPHFSCLFLLQALFALPPLLPSSPPPFFPLFLTPGKLRFGYPSDLCTL